MVCLVKPMDVDEAVCADLSGGGPQDEHSPLPAQTLAPPLLEMY